MVLRTCKFFISRLGLVLKPVSFDRNLRQECSWFLSIFLSTGTLPLTTSRKHSHIMIMKLFGATLIISLSLLSNISSICLSIYSSFSFFRFVIQLIMKVNKKMKGQVVWYCIKIAWSRMFLDTNQWTNEQTSALLQVHSYISKNLCWWR